jgi:hypothetical protein
MTPPMLTITFRNTASSRACVADWLIRELLPVGLRHNALTTAAGCLEQLPPVDPALVGEPLRLRRQCQIARRTWHLADQHFWDIYRAAGSPPIHSDSAHIVLADELGQHVLAAALYARNAIAGRVGLWAYSAFITCAWSLYLFAADIANDRFRRAVADSYTAMFDRLGREPGTRVHTVITMKEAFYG